MFIVSGFENDGEGKYRQGFCTITPTINEKAWKSAARTDPGFDVSFKRAKSGGGGTITIK